FSVEKRVIPRLLRENWKYEGEYADLFFRYRDVSPWGRDSGSIVTFYLLPKSPVAGQAVYFRCIRNCTAYADFSETITMSYSFAFQHLSSWRDVDRNLRKLLTGFMVR